MSLRIPSPRRAVLLGVALCAFAAPAAADARGTISYDGTTMTFTGDGGADIVNIGPSQGELAWTTSGLDAVPAECKQDEYVDYLAYCPWPQKIVVRLGDGDDRFSVTDKAWDPIPGNLFIESHGDGGADRLQSGNEQHGGPGNDKLEGHEGDQLLRGGPGDDLVQGLAGRDQVFGDEGADNVSGDGFKSASADVVDGGPGEDVIDNDWVDDSQKASAPVTLTLDGRADDGRPGEGDNVTGIERFKVYSGGTFNGTDGADTYEIEPGEFRTPATVNGNGGNDRLVGDDDVETIDGGAGDDYVEGGFNNDTLVGGPGKDTIFADETGAFCNYATYCLKPFGNDTIDVRDGEADTVDCGIGTDTVKADPIDVLSECESVDTGPKGPVGPVGPPNDPQIGPGPQGGQLGLTIRGAKLQAALRRGLTVRVVAPGAGRLAATAVRGARTVGRGSTKATSAGAKTIRVRFSRAGKRALRRARTARLTVLVRFTPKKGAAVTERRAVTLRR
jgi:hypothetical protein